LSESDSGDERDGEGESPLVWASSASVGAEAAVAIVRALLGAGADPKKRMADGSTPVLVFAARGRHELIEPAFVAGADLDVRDSVGGESALYVAARAGHADAVRTLVRLGASVDGTTGGRETPLSAAAVWGRLDAVQALLDARANPNALDAAGDGPLHKAAEHGHAEVLRALLAAGGDPSLRADKRAGGGRTPLEAAQSGTADAASRDACVTLLKMRHGKGATQSI